MLQDHIKITLQIKSSENNKCIYINELYLITPPKNPNIKTILNNYIHRLRRLKKKSNNQNKNPEKEIKLQQHYGAGEELEIKDIINLCDIF